MRRDLYSVSLRRYGEEHEETLIDAYNLADNLLRLMRFTEAKALLRKTIPVARRVLGASHEQTTMMSGNYALALYKDPGATLDDLREAVNTLEETERIARRLLGSAHPKVMIIETYLPEARAILRAREPPSRSA